MIPTKSIEILLVEDNPGDARLTSEALTEKDIFRGLHLVDDGVKAVEFLRRQGEYRQAPRPDLIILDLNLPKKDGREVLAEIKGDDDLKSIPVVVLTTSRSAEDIDRSYRLSANSFVTKPLEFDEYIAAVQEIHCFWLTTATLPGG